MYIEKMRLSVCEFVYWVNINVNIKATVKWCAICLAYQQTQTHKKTIPYYMLYKLWVVIGADIFYINNNTIVYCR